MAIRPTFKQSKVFVLFSFLRQAAMGAALDPALLDHRMPLALDARPMPTRRVTRDDARDITGRYLVGRRLTSALALWSVQFDVSAALAAWLYALAYGDPQAPTGAGPHVHNINRLASDNLPATSFLIGAEDSDEPAELYRDMKLNTLDLEATIRGKVTARASFVGSAFPQVIAAGGFTMPACETPAPVYANDCQLTIGGTDYTDNLRTFAHRFNNNLAANDDPFIFDAVDLARLERTVETSLIQLGVYGTKNHPLYVAAEAETAAALALRIGSAAEGAQLVAPSAQLTLGDTPITYATEANRSVVNIDATPLSVACAIPDHVVATLAHADRFLTVPA